jgi:hypothetical protein
MAAGTWNQGELEKRVTKIDLENYPTIEFRDTSLISDGIFDVVDFPKRFTAGKNLIKIRANNSNTLVKNSKIHFEILDFNGDPIYYEPLNYLEHDGTRVIAIYIFPGKTAPGIGRVYIAGRTRFDLDNGNVIPTSKNWQDVNYINNPNILWSRAIAIAPENSKNNTEIIFTRPYPKAIVRERVNRYFQPINLTDVAVDKPGTGTVTLKAIPATTAPPKISSPIFKEEKANYEGAASAKTPMKSVGKQVVIIPEVKKFKTSPTDEAANKKGQPVEVESAEIVTISTFSRLETNGFALSSSMEGGTITIVNPNVDLLQGNSLIDANGRLIPNSQVTTDWAAVTSYELGDTAIQLSGSYTFVIDKILSSTKANVFQTKGFKNTEENTFGAFSFITNGAQSQHEIKDINATSNFTCSFVLPFVLSETQQSQSFAEIVLSNIEPATGDVHKIQTLYKPSGQFGDFIDAGSVEVEQVEILEDVTSYESIQSIGMVYNRIGFFTDLNDFNKYWETANGFVTPEVALTAAYKPDVLLDGIELTPDSAFDSTSNRFGYLHLKSEYHPIAYENTRYELTLNATAEDTVSTDLNIKYPRLDVYISGSSNTIETNSEYINQYKVSNLDIPVNEFNLGTRISTIELTPGQSFDDVPILLYFKNLKEQDIDVYFVVRRGKWAFSNLSLKSDKQTGFSPNFTRINTRIPSEFLETPLTFKFRYFDIGNNKAQAETSVFPVTFYGDNLVIDGDNNLLNGSVYIGNTIGSGIELAGVNSGFIRSIGYEGFKSASRTDQPGGFMLYTGSVLPDAPDNYAGVGIEIVQDSSSYFKFDTTNGIDIRTKKFFIGTEDSQFVSGSNNNVEISSSNFHLKPDGGLVIGGDTVIKADLSVDQLFLPAGTDADDARAYIDSNGVAKFSGDAGGAYKVVFNGNGTSTIGSWIINDASLSGGSGGTTIALTPGSGIHMGDATFGSAPFSVTNAGVLKASSGTVGGWTLASDRITGGDMIIRENGTIESAGFQTNVPGSGFRLTAASGGFLEVENARIRGTLSTAVFEKETVNAVGGQLYVANSTVLTASIENPNGSYSSTDTTMSVVNVSGFTDGEILSAKKVSDTGFQTEYLKVNSASRNDPSSDINLSGKIFVTRAYGHGVAGDSGSLGGAPGGSQTYTGSQVIVSTGKIGTGYIRLNANPNDQATPYMQIVERTGNGIYDLDLKAQLGDLSGITDNINGTDVSGFGLYTDNAFLKGGIIATYGSIGTLNIGSESISIGAGAHDDENTAFFVSGGGEFSLGDQLVWDGTNLTVRGSITITNPQPGFVTPAQTGSITDGFVSNDATSSLLSSDDTGSFLTPDDTGSLLTAAATESLENPATYQFGGTDGFTLGTHTVSTGLNMNADFLGYFDSTTPKTFMSSSGDFYLGGTGGAFKWDESEGSLLVSGSNVTLFTPQFFLGTLGTQFVSGSNGNLEISSSGFHLTTAGDLTASNADFDGYAVARALREKVITINASNMHLYIIRTQGSEALDGTFAYKGVVVDNLTTFTSTLVLDGSRGGEIVSHVILDLDLLMEDLPVNPVQEQCSMPGFGADPICTNRVTANGAGTEYTNGYYTRAMNTSGTETSFPDTLTMSTGKYAGALRYIIGPPAVGGAVKTPVTISTSATANVEFYMPLEPVAGDTGFGSIATGLREFESTSQIFERD